MVRKVGCIEILFRGVAEGSLLEEFPCSALGGKVCKGSLNGC